jgi:hypothetical protein
MTSIEDIPFLPDREERISEVTVDCYGQAEELSAFEVYFTDAMQFPFEATWRDPDEPGHSRKVKVLGVDSVSDRRGILLKAELAAGKPRRIVAEQVWAKDEKSSNATILDDYRYWVNEMYGLDPGYE